MKKGFTLIELLVVVLIIGILAAVALPQYTKAVEKARAAEAMQMLGDMATAESIYYMSKNEFTENLENLDLSFPGVYAGTSNAKAKIAPTTATDKNCADTSSYYICVKKSGTSIEGKAVRISGPYAGENLTITVADSGAISKGGTLAQGREAAEASGDTPAVTALPALAPQWKN